MDTLSLPLWGTTLHYNTEGATAQGSSQPFSLHFHSESGSGFLHHPCESRYRIRFCKLIKHPKLSRIGRIESRYFYTLHGVDYVYKTSRLASSPIHRQGVA